MTNKRYNVKEIKEITDPEFAVWLSPVTLIGIDKSEKDYKGEMYLANVSIVRTSDLEYFKIANGKAAWKKYLYFLCAYGNQIGKKYNLQKGEPINESKWIPNIE